MPDDRNGTPAGSTPFGRLRGTNGAHSSGGHANGAPRSPVDLPTRPLPVDVADGPIDLVAVQADDELVNALGAGAVVTYGDRPPGSDPAPRRTRDERVVAMLAAWRAEIEADPIPELIDLDTAVAAVVAGVKADAAGTRRKRADRLRHLAPLAAAAAIIVATVTGVGLGSQNAMPGDALWPVQKVVNPDRAESVETKLVVESRFEAVRTALETGDTETAASLLQAVGTEIPEVRDEEGQPQLLQEREFLAAKLADTSPGEPADLSTPPESKPSARSTTSAAAPPSPSASSSSSKSADPDDPSQSKPVGPDVRRERTPSAALVPAPPSASDSDKPSTSDSGSSTPDVTKQPDKPKPAPDNTEGSTDPITKPAPSSGGQPVSEAGTSHPGSGRAEGGTTTTDTTASGTTASGMTASGTTASGSAGTKVDATGTTTTS
jgi:Anti-sigma-D factor RsdA to sigma factor binding region